MGFFDCVTVSLHILYTASKGLTKTLCGFRSKEHLASEHVIETQEKRLKVEKKIVISWIELLPSHIVHLTKISSLVSKYLSGCLH